MARDIFRQRIDNIAFINAHVVINRYSQDGKSFQKMISETVLRDALYYFQKFTFQLYFIFIDSHFMRKIQRSVQLFPNRLICF